uniref:Uncharacterized protein n=1 Tax=Rhizophora mucronata TaxID=61149 RepID=A0A2P2NXL6_RHIMU
MSVYHIQCTLQVQQVRWNLHSFLRCYIYA